MSTTFQGAVVTEQGVTFAIAVVQPRVLQSTSVADDARRRFRSLFGGIPTVLMAQDGSGRPTYYGRPDIVDFLASIHISRIPWKQYQIS